MENESFIPHEKGLYLDKEGNVWEAYGDGVYRLSNTGFMYSDDRYLMKFAPFRKLTVES